jgi:predicted deacylase
MCYPAVSVGDEVEEGQAVGRIGSLFGEPLGEIIAPHGGYVLFLTSSPAMRQDGLVLAIGAA